MKIVLNGDYGGFGLSHEAQALYVLAKGQTPYFYLDASTYNDGCKKIHRYKHISLQETQLYNSFRIICTTKDQGEILYHYPESIWHHRDIDRTDPDLISIVEIMGSAASSKYAHLVIEEVPDGTLYKIDYYDGLESLITQEDDDWLIARDQTQSSKSLIENLWRTIHPEKE